MRYIKSIKEHTRNGKRKNMFTSLVELPHELKRELECLSNRLIVNFIIADYAIEEKPNKEKYYRVKIMVGENIIWGAFRKTVEHQLIDAGVCLPELNPIQEQAWKELKQVLYQFYNPLEVQTVLFQQCRNATLQGWIDEIESYLPLSTYLRCKKLIKQLETDTFASSYNWYFGSSPRDDHWRGLE